MAVGFCGQAVALEKNMNLIERMMEDCTMIDKRSKPDGLGSFKSEWVDGAEFKAAIVKDNSMQAKIAQKSGVTELYTITVHKGTPLVYHDVFRREADGSIFRITSNIHDSESPKAATFAIGQVTAERWELE